MEVFLDSSSVTTYSDYESEYEFFDEFYPTPRQLLSKFFRVIGIIFKEKKTKSALYLVKRLTLFGSLIGIIFGGKIGGIVGAIFGLASGFGFVAIAIADGFVARYGPDSSEVVCL